MEIVADTKRLESGSVEILKNGVCAGIAATVVVATSPIVTGFVAVGALGSIVAHEAAKKIFQCFPDRFSSSFLRGCTVVAAIAFTLFSAIYVSSFFVVPAAIHTLTVLSVGALYTGMQGALFCIAALSTKIFEKTKTDVREPLPEEIKIPSSFGVGNSFKSVISWCKAHPKTIIFTLYSIKGTLTLLGSLYFGSKLFSSASTLSSPPNVGGNKGVSSNSSSIANHDQDSSPLDSNIGDLLKNRAQTTTAPSVKSPSSALSSLLNNSEQPSVANHDQDSFSCDANIGGLFENRTQTTTVLSANSSLPTLSSFPDISEQYNTLFTVATVAVIGAAIMGVIGYHYMVAQKKKRAPFSSLKQQQTQQCSTYTSTSSSTRTGFALSDGLEKSKHDNSLSDKDQPVQDELPTINPEEDLSLRGREGCQTFCVTLLREQNGSVESAKESLKALIKTLSPEASKIQEEDPQEVDRVKEQVTEKLKISEKEAFFVDSTFPLEKGAKCRSLLAQEALFEALLEGGEYQALLAEALSKAQAYFQAVLQCRLIDTNHEKGIDMVLSAAAVLLFLEDLQASPTAKQSVVIEISRKKRVEEQHKDLRAVSWVFKKVLDRKDRPETGTIALQGNLQFYWAISYNNKTTFYIETQTKTAMAQEVKDLITGALVDYPGGSPVHSCLTSALSKEELSCEEGFTFCEDLLGAMLRSKEGGEAALAQQVLSLFFSPFCQGTTEDFEVIFRAVSPLPIQDPLRASMLFKEINTNKERAKLAGFLSRARATLRHEMYQQIGIYGVKSEHSRTFDLPKLLEKAFEVAFVKHLKESVKASSIKLPLEDESVSLILEDVLRPLIGLEEPQKEKLRTDMQASWKKSKDLAFSLEGNIFY